MILEMTGEAVDRPTRHKGNWRTRQILPYPELLKKVVQIWALIDRLDATSYQEGFFRFGRRHIDSDPAARGRVGGLRFRIAELYHDELMS